MPGVQGIDQEKKWESETACLSAIFGERVNCQINQGDNFVLNVHPRFIELRNHEHYDKPIGHTPCGGTKSCLYNVDEYGIPEYGLNVVDTVHNSKIRNSKRGIIGGFSKKSSIRMKKTIEDNLDDLKIFQTFTYPDEVFDGMDFEERAVFTRYHFDLFKRRAEYRGWFGFWRKEWEDRKSGKYTGELVPHYHCIFSQVGISDVNYTRLCRELGQTWVDSMRLADLSVYRKALKVSTNYNFRGSKGNAFEYLDGKAAVSRYVAKYMAKADKELIPEGISIGRSWGRIGKVKQAVPVEIRLTKQQMIRFTRVCRGLYRSTAKKVRKKYLSCHRVPAFIFMLAENSIRCLEYLKGVNPLEQTFVDVPF